jgi:hypothetical protein
MSQAGPLFAGTGADDSGTGTVSWTNPGNVTGADDGVVATCSLQLTQASHYLDATNFGFTIPAGSTITDILVEWKYQEGNNATSHLFDNAIRIIKGGTVGSTDNSKGTEWPTSLTWESYDGVLWGTTWLPSDVNASNFGAALSVKRQSGGSGSITASVDACRITITYTPPGATPLRQVKVVAPQPPASSFD